MMAGWEVDEMAVALPAVLDLAAASGTDLGTTSDIVTDALTGFGMQAGEAAGFADLLASASSNSNTNVELMGETFKYVAPLFGALGYSAEDAALATGLMANAGIKGGQAGTALRGAITRLVSPTEASAKEMQKLGISMTDANGEMKPFNEVIHHLRDRFGDLSEEQQAQAASTIFGKESMSGMLAIINATDEDVQKLTDATTDYDGAAKDMAETMQDNLQGSLEKMKSGLEEAGISLAENLIPMMEKGVGVVTDLAAKFGELDDEQKENIVKWGLILAAAGPVLGIFGKLMSVTGSIAGGIGTLTGAIGTASGGAGLVASMSLLGPLAIGGVAIAGIAGIAYVVDELRDKSEELEEVNLEVADSFQEQAKDLQESVNTFERLSDKANITNTELSELNSLNEKISKSSNPGEIKLLQEQYDKLAEKSGLSKDELQLLFDVSTIIIDQAPQVEQAIDAEGNAFVRNTEKVQEYINSLHEMSLERLDAEREKALRNEAKLMGDINELEREKTKLTEGFQNINSAITGDLEDQAGRLEDVKKLLEDNNTASDENKLTAEEHNALIAEREILQHLENGNNKIAHELYEDYLLEFDKELGMITTKLDGKKEELEQLSLIEEQMANVLLAQVGITEEGAEGLAQLDKKMELNKEEIQDLELIKGSKEGLTDEQQKQLDTLILENEELQKTKIAIEEKTGLYADLNDIAQTKLESADKETQAYINQLAELEGIYIMNNDILGSIDAQIKGLQDEKTKLEANLKVEGANKDEINKQIKSLDIKIGKQAEVKKKALEELGLWEDTDQSIKDGIESEINKGKAVDDTSGKLGGQGKGIDNNNEKTAMGIRLEEQRSKEAGKDVDKDVNANDHGSIEDINTRSAESKNKRLTVLDYGTVASIDRRVQIGKKKPINLHDNNTLAPLERRASSPISKLVNFFTGKKPKYAKGTPRGGHPGGLATIGDGGGRELVSLPSGRAFLSSATDMTLPLPKGTHVTPHRETAQLMRNIPSYAKGTNGNLNTLLGISPSGVGSNRGKQSDINVGIDYDRLANALVDGLTREGITKPANIYLDKRKVGKGLVDIMSNELSGKSSDRNTGRGVPAW